MKDTSSQSTIIPPKRVRYLSEIAETIKEYDDWVNEQATIATKLYQLDGTIKTIAASASPMAATGELQKIKTAVEEKLNPECKKID